MKNQISNQLIISAIYFAFLSTFLTAALQKWKSGVPDWFIKQFENTFIPKLPGGTAFGFWMITALESAVAVILIISLAMGEWFAEAPKFLLQTGVGLAAVTFSFLGFGLRIAGDFQGAANLFLYFGASIASSIYLRLFQ